MGGSGFLPSRHGLHFPNAWPAGTPDLVVHTPLGDIPVGNASAGLCGGFCFTARDLFDAGRLPPDDRQAPSAGSPVIEYLTWRLLASWNIPIGILKYFQWANTPDHDAFLGRVAGTGHLTINELPAITASLDGGRPCPLGLVTVHSSDPQMLGHCHQVLAYAYNRSGTTVTVSVYDPNAPDDDTIYLRLDTADPARATIEHTVRIGGLPVRGFFATPYIYHDPATLLTGSAILPARPQPPGPALGLGQAPPSPAPSAPRRVR